MEIRNQPLKREAILGEHEMKKAVRQGKWKLLSRVQLAGKQYKSEPGELYNIETERTEAHNLAVANPALVKKMSQLWEAYAQRTHVCPARWTEAK